MRATLAAVLLLLTSASAWADDALWSRLREGGYAIAIRHARAPGTGDPPDFRVEDCGTQRNLSAEGRAQARALGEAFRARDVPVERVLSSGWCRALDTARLAFGTVERDTALDSFFTDRGHADDKTAAVRALIGAWPKGAGNLILVTHQVNITALTGIVPAEGEMIVLSAGPSGTVTVVGRLRP